jgi:DNA polymerase elongation subunit (family B)
MTTLIFDIETNGLLHDVTHIHCLGIYDTETKQTLVYNDEGDTEPLTRGIQRLEDADLIVGHNIINYDLPVIRKLYPWFTNTGRVLDTLVLSRLYHADILKTDQTRKWNKMPLQLYGRHSLESYGYRLGEYKGDYGKTADWKEWSQEMQDYCLQDVNVTVKLWHHFLTKINLEKQKSGTN